MLEDLLETVDGDIETRVPNGDVRTFPLARRPREGPIPTGASRKRSVISGVDP